MKRHILLAIVLICPLILLAQNRYDIVIDEIMADPSPQVGLPNIEWIELRNTSSSAINLLNWRIGDASNQSGPIPSITLQPDSFLIICSSSAFAAMSVFGRTVSVTNFPSLDNGGDQLFLRTATGTTIHAVSYSDAWYRNVIKKEGGWTLEMMDTKNPCAGLSNWIASTNISGGSPGKKNATDDHNQDLIIPRLRRAYTTDSLTIILLFDESLDSLSGATNTNYSIDGGLNIISASSLPPLFDQVQLKLGIPMVLNTIYKVTCNSVKDCGGNPILTGSQVKVGLPSDPQPGEFIINEILFNPRPGGYDYVEFYNNSSKIFDASQLLMASRNSSGVVSSLRSLSSDPFYIFPGDYLVETENAENLQLNYFVPDNERITIISSPPALPDDKGVVIVLNAWGIIVDEVDYEDDWHFKLIDNDEGVALERIDPAGISQDKNNWHSAASTSGYGTPTYKNSQYILVNSINATIEVVPKIFSPDNDGHDDIATIQYAVTEPGYLANITLFDAAGRPVRYLVRNGTLGLKGYWNWDGLGDKGQQLPVGTYVVFTEIFNLAGKKQSFKNLTVLARKLN